MRFKNWLESLELNALRSHLKNPKLDIASHAWDFLSWKGSKQLLTRLKIDPKTLRQSMENGEEDFYTVADKIGQSMAPKEVEDFLRYMNNNNPGDVPSHSLMDLQNHGRKGHVPPTTWLVHFTDNADEVGESGFEQGQSDINRLALTTHQGKAEKQYGGYNFAFFADSKYAVQAARSGKYGKDAVMFQAAGISIYHHSDDENQVVVWGKDVPTSAMVLLIGQGDNEWMVRARHLKRDEVFKGDFKSCVGWITQNYRQYRKVL